MRVPDNLHRWFWKTLQDIRNKWWLWFLLFLYRIVEDRIMSIINAWLDSFDITSWIFVINFFAWLGPLGFSGFIFLLVLLGIVIHAYIDSRRSDVSTMESQKQKAIVDFYNNRNEAPKLRELFGNAKKVLCLLRTGAMIKETDFLTWAKVTNAILMHPHGNYIDSHIRLHGPEQSFVSEIRNLTTKLIKPGTSVRWYDGPIPNSMILGDPESETDGVIQVEVSCPYSNSDQRPVFLVRAKNNPILFENLKNQYYEIANKSDLPNLEQSQLKTSEELFKLDPFKRAELKNQNVTVVGLRIESATDRRLEHCSVRIQKIEPSDPDSIYWVFSDSKIATPAPTEETFGLNPRDKRDVPIAQLDVINAGLANLGIELLCFSTEKYPALDLEQSYILTIRVSANVGKPIERKYKLWVDDLKQLCFQAARNSNE